MPKKGEKRMADTTTTNITSSVGFTSDKPKVDPVLKSTPVPSTQTTYTVKEGDTLLDVANKYKVAYQQLRYFNEIDRLKPILKPGQVLKIPTSTVYVPLDK